MQQVCSNGWMWSRHITKSDRIIYDVYDDIVSILIVEVEGHYDDK
jgi:toxin YoeB